MSNSAIPWTAACQASCPAQLPRVGSNSCSLITTSFCAALFSYRIFYLLNISIRIFSSVLSLHIMWSKYWSFSISPSNEYSRLISFRINWFDLLAVQGILFLFVCFCLFFVLIFTLFYFTILYWFCHTLT